MCVEEGKKVNEEHEEEKVSNKNERLTMQMIDYKVDNVMEMGRDREIVCDEIKRVDEHETDRIVD